MPFKRHFSYEVKLLVFIIICFMFITGCNTESSAELNEAKAETENLTETVAETTEVTEPDSILCDNIQEIDLDKPENSKYLQYVREFTYNEEYELPDGSKIIEDKNLYLEEQSGKRTALIEVPDEQTEKYVKFCDMIDDNRFYYYIIWHESTAGTGIYNLATGEDFRIDKSEDNWHYIPVKVIGNNLLLKKCKIATCGGLAKLDLDSYEVTDFKCSFMTSDKNYSNVDFSFDGTKAAMYKRTGIAKNENDMNEYTISIYYLNDDKILNNYIIRSKNDYINYRVLYYNDSQIYFYAFQYGEDPKNYLYIIDLN